MNKLYKTILSVILLKLFFSCQVFGQDGIYQYEPIEPDTTFQPYIKFNEETGDYIIGYMKSKTTGKIYETLYIPITKVDPILDINVYKEKTNYKYKYTLIAGEKSKQDISSYELEIKKQSERIDLPSPWLYSEMSEVPFVLFTHKILEMPEWKDGDPIKFESDLQQGEKLEFNVISKHLPSLITSYFSGQPKQLDLSFVIPPSFEVRQMVDSLRENVINDRGFKLKTIGPKALPENISNPALIDTLQSYLSFSCDTTWIENPGLCRSLQAKLENVERQLQRGNTSPARGSLQAFLNEVEAQQGKQLSSEAYALLYFNGQYLLERL